MTSAGRSSVAVRSPRPGRRRPGRGPATLAAASVVAVSVAVVLADPMAAFWFSGSSDLVADGLAAGDLALVVLCGAVTVATVVGVFVRQRIWIVAATVLGLLAAIGSALGWAAGGQLASVGCNDDVCHSLLGPVTAQWQTYYLLLGVAMACAVAAAVLDRRLAVRRGDL